MVPGTAVAKLTAPSTEAALEMEKLFDYVEGQPVTGTIETENEEITIELVGKGAHGASPQSGINAGTFLAVF